MRLAFDKSGDRLKTAGINVLAVFSRLPLTWRGVGALVIGISLARWTWILFAPQTLSVFPPKSNIGVKESEKIFGTAAASNVPTNNTDAGLGNVHLVGVFTGKQAFAVFKTDEKTQRGFALGEDVVKGTKLTAVEADHVVLEHNGMRQQLFLENKSGKNKDTLALDQHSSTVGVDQAVSGWNQAQQAMKKDRTQKRMEKTKEVHE